LCPCPNSYIKALTYTIVVFEDGGFGRKSCVNEVMKVGTSRWN
jgi:hypothetical protein